MNIFKNFNVFDIFPDGWAVVAKKWEKKINLLKELLSVPDWTMNNWKTFWYHNYQDGQIKTDHFSVNTGIFQGESSSGLLSILSLLSLSWLLKTSNIGYKINPQSDIISNLLLIDDLILLPANDNQLVSMKKIINKFSDNNEMSFRIDKCKKLTIQRGKFFKWKTSSSIMVKN